MRRIGIDIGSTYTKYCCTDTAGEICELICEKTPLRQKEFFAKRLQELMRTYPDAEVVSCGYGKKNIASVRQVSELTALAAGANYLCPGIPVILDIGGQDTKVIRQENGRLVDFFTNERCAAGCGMFLYNILNLLQLDFQELDFSGMGCPEIKLSSVCAVFAQSEIVELLAEDVPEQKIIHAVVWQILSQAGMLLGKVDCKEILLSGGISEIKGTAAMAELVFEKKVSILPESRYLSAVGCAVK